MEFCLYSTYTVSISQHYIFVQWLFEFVRMCIPSSLRREFAKVNSLKWHHKCLFPEVYWCNCDGYDADTSRWGCEHSPSANKVYDVHLFCLHNLLLSTFEYLTTCVKFLVWLCDVSGPPPPPSPQQKKNHTHLNPFHPSIQNISQMLKFSHNILLKQHWHSHDLQAHILLFLS